MKSIRFFIAMCFIALTGCGGGGSGSEIAAPSTYAISGTLTTAGVPVADATVTLSGGATATTDANGNYSFTGLASGNYTLTPSKTGVVFNPVNATVTVNDENISNTNFVVTDTGAAYSQADLTGTWRMTMLRDGDGSPNGLLRFNTTVDSLGFWTSATVIENTGISYPLADNSIRFLIDSNGVFTESGINGVSDGHMTMASNKKFFAGTGSDGSSQLRIGQKVVPGTMYSNADLQNKTFVYHALWRSNSLYNAAWMHGAGSTDATGLATVSSHTNSFGGSAGMNELNGLLLVDANGNVTNTNNSHIHGFMSDDKKTIVVTDDSSTSGGLYVIQITGRTYNAGPLSDGVTSAHLLAVGAAPAPFWLRYTSTAASNGIMTLSDWVSNNPAVTAPGGTFTGTISTSGTVSIAEVPSFHGQKSDDGKFMVATMTNSNGTFSLQVNTN